MWQIVCQQAVAEESYDHAQQGQAGGCVQRLRQTIGRLQGAPVPHAAAHWGENIPGFRYIIVKFQIFAFSVKYFYQFFIRICLVSLSNIISYGSGVQNFSNLNVPSSNPVPPTVS
jgi:hypothetical protein